MTKQDGAKDATSFVFTEEVRVFCVKAPCPPIKRTVIFEDVKKAPVGCGSFRYTATEKMKPDFHHKLVQPRRTIQVVDHTKDFAKIIANISGMLS